MNIKVQYTTLIVNDLEESAQFYRDVLGFREGYHVDTPDGGAITIMESDGASVELICNRNYPMQRSPALRKPDTRQPAQWSPQRSGG